MAPSILPQTSLPDGILDRWKGEGDTMTDDYDGKMFTFKIICKKCGSEDCTTDRKMYPEMRGECAFICLSCGNKEFCD